MRTNGKCNDSHAPVTSSILLSARTQYSRKEPDYEKNINTISMYEKKLYQLFLDYSNAQVISCFQFCNMAWVNALLCPTSYNALLCPTSYAKRSFFLEADRTMVRFILHTGKPGYTL